ncbi:MAG: hypothetical protein EXX96DRAFT_565269 [Benjaminiella poitrasii]|nr:MAG: hypothetical protein EXX96DRAFT_565269 [Benjaminiella poitrasii]
MRTKGTNINRNLQKDSATTLFLPIDNKSELQSSQQLKNPVRRFKSIQPDPKGLVTTKENWNSHVFIASPYDQPTSHYPMMKRPIQVVRSATNYNTTMATERSRNERPTMGGKTISAISSAPTCTAERSHIRMSSQELKLLSRRIDPHEPLSSPHASPKKPPLPNLNRKRHYQRHNHHSEQDEMSRSKRVKTYDMATDRRYVCEPCHKVYKTRNGLTYHKEKCKYQKYNETASKTIIHCICSRPTEDKGTMIECTKCNTWLHLKCTGGVTNEESYCCPRCDTTTQHISAASKEEMEDEHQQEEEETSQVEPEELSSLTNQDQFDFTHLFSNDLLDNDNTANTNDGFIMTLDSLSSIQPQPGLDNNNPALVEEDSSWANEFSVDFGSSDWYNDDTPSLLLSDNHPSSSSFLDLDLPSSPQADWLHLANFEVDFTSDFINY